MITLYKYNNKAVARRAYIAGETIKLYANKVRPNNMWIEPVTINIADGVNGDIQGYQSTDFDTRINHFEHYNCSFETGYYTSFYVDVEVSR